MRNIPVSAGILPGGSPGRQGLGPVFIVRVLQEGPLLQNDE